MFIMGNFINAVAIIIDYLLTAYTWIIIAQAILSWVRPDPYSPIVRFLYSVTEPVLRPIRSRMPAGLGGFDFSPMVVILAIVFLQHFVVDTLRQLARQM
jgi:YggT family protein